jgi:hypothetical protein
MFDLKERTIIRGYLDSGMTPDAVANYIGRVSDLEDSDILLIRSVATDMLNETATPPPPRPQRPVLTLIQGGHRLD